MRIDNLSDFDLIPVLLRNRGSKDLDYKSAMAWNEDEKRSCCCLVKDILAMANTQGGYLVIGVSEAANGFSFDGLTDDQAKTFDTSRVNRFLQAYADPPINAQLRKIPHDGKVFVVIEVPAFTDTPHITQKDFPGVLASSTLYVRTANNESAAVRSAADFRSVVEQAVRNRRDTLLTSFRSILTSGSLAAQPSARERYDEQRQLSISAFEAENPLKSKEPLLGYTEVAFMPDGFDPDRFSFDTLRGAINRAHVTYTGWPFLFVDSGKFDCPHTIQDGWETFFQTNDFAGIDMLDFWRLQQSGFFYQRCVLRPYSDRENIEPVADLRMLAVYVGEAVDCLVRLYGQMLDETEYVTFLFRALNTKNRTLVNSRGMMPLFNMYTCHIDNVVVERRLPLADWRAGVIAHATDILKDIYLRFNWQQPNLDLARNAIERTFKRQM